MKTLILVALVVLSGGVCSAQTTPNENAAPGVMVVEQGWRRFWARNPALDEDPLRRLENQDHSERIRKEVVRQNTIRAEAGKDQAPLPSRNATNPISARPPAHPFVYSYRVKITNTGVKKINALIWEYVFIDPSTGSVVSRRRFASKVSIRAGKSTKLFGRSTLPPVVSVDAGKASEGPEGQHAERVLITRIYYDDNSVWEHSIE